MTQQNQNPNRTSSSRTTRSRASGQQQGGGQQKPGQQSGQPGQRAARAAGRPEDQNRESFRSYST